MAGYSEIVMDHYTSPSNRRMLATATVVGKASFDNRAPFVMLYLRIDQKVIVEASFEAAGCGVTIAACSMLTELVLNQSVGNAERIDEAALTQALGGIPEHKRHSIQIAISALRDAFRQSAF